MFQHFPSKAALYREILHAGLRGRPRRSSGWRSSSRRPPRWSRWSSSGAARGAGRARRRGRQGGRRPAGAAQPGRGRRVCPAGVGVDGRADPADILGLLRCRGGRAGDLRPTRAAIRRNAFWFAYHVAAMTAFGRLSGRAGLSLPGRRRRACWPTWPASSCAASGWRTAAIADPFGSATPGSRPHQQPPEAKTDEETMATVHLRRSARRSGPSEAKPRRRRVVVWFVIVALLLAWSAAASTPSTSSAPRRSPTSSRARCRRRPRWRRNPPASARCRAISTASARSRRCARSRSRRSWRDGSNRSRSSPAPRSRPAHPWCS